MQEQTLELVENLLNSLKSRGIKKTCELLKIKKTESIFDTDEYARFIVSNVCRLTGVQSHALINDRYVRGENKFAIGLCVFYLSEKYSLNDMQRKLFISKGKSLLYSYKSDILNLKSKNKADQKYLLIKKQMDELIEKY